MTTALAPAEASSPLLAAARSWVPNAEFGIRNIDWEYHQEGRWHLLKATVEFSGISDPGVLYVKVGTEEMATGSPPQLHEVIRDSVGFYAHEYNKRYAAQLRGEIPWIAEGQR